MSFSLDGFWIKHIRNASEAVDEFCSSSTSIHNDIVWLLKPENTIQYHTIKTNSFALYNTYLSKVSQPEHSQEVFKQLIENWSLDKCEPIQVNAYDHSTFFWVQDGNHRLAYMKFKRLFGNNIPFKYVNVNFYEKAQDVLKDALRKTVGKSQYNGWSNRLEFGYHSFDLFNIHIQGQRNPKQRFEKIKNNYDFTGKTVLDLGCNTGGMLLHIPEIQRGLGVDYDQNCIDSCNIFRDRLNYSCKLDFVKEDLNNINIPSFCQRQGLKPDIIFLLSIGSWVKEWKKLYTDAYAVSSDILLETNNEYEGKQQLELFQQLGANIHLISDKSDDDITGNLLRKTYLITKKSALQVI